MISNLKNIDYKNISNLYNECLGHDKHLYLSQQNSFLYDQKFNLLNKSSLGTSHNNKFIEQSSDFCFLSEENNNLYNQYLELEQKFNLLNKSSLSASHSDKILYQPYEQLYILQGDTYIYEWIITNPFICYSILSVVILLFINIVAVLIYLF